MKCPIAKSIAKKLSAPQRVRVNALLDVTKDFSGVPDPSVSFVEECEVAVLVWESARQYVEAEVNVGGVVDLFVEDMVTRMTRTERDPSEERLGMILAR